MLVGCALSPYRGDAPKSKPISDSHDLPTVESQLRELFRRVGYIDGNGIDPDGGALGRDRRELTEYKHIMFKKCEKYDNLSNRLTALLWITAGTLAGAWGGGGYLLKLVKFVAEVVK